MDLASLRNNIFESVKTTGTLYDAIKKIFWLYKGMNPPAYWRNKLTKINFAFPKPIGKVSLKVRYNKGSDAFIISEVFQNQCYLISSDVPVKTILDLGANAGFTAIYFSRLFPEAQIACVEPMPNNIIVLKENLRLNNISIPVFEAAASVHDTLILMECSDKDYGNKVHGIPFGKDIGNSTIRVSGVSIDLIIQKLAWEQVDLLKIDIEGYEGILLVENNSWLAKVKMIIIEIHEGVTIDLVKKAIRKYGFVHSKFQQGNWILSKASIN